MIFYSDKFYYDGTYSEDCGIYLVSEKSEILSEYGVSYNQEENNEIVLTFCYANSLNQPLPWDVEVLESFLEWVITDEYKEFISEDNEEIAYFFKGISYKKRFTFDMKGLVDVTFKVMSPCGYRKSVLTASNGETGFSIVNPSNISKPYKPIIELKNIMTPSITITNTTSNKNSFTIENLSDKDVYIDNMMGTVTDSDGKNLIMNTNRSWIELEKGKNIINVEGDCTITFISYYPSMV